VSVLACSALAVALTTLMHTTKNYTVDSLLALVLIVSGVIGAQIGTQIGLKLKAEQLRILLALLVLAMCFELALGFVLRPAEVFSIFSTS